MHKIVKFSKIAFSSRRQPTFRGIAFHPKLQNWRFVDTKCDFAKCEYLITICKIAFRIYETSILELPRAPSRTPNLPKIQPRPPRGHHFIKFVISKKWKRHIVVLQFSKFSQTYKFIQFVHKIETYKPPKLGSRRCETLIFMVVKMIEKI